MQVAEKEVPFISTGMGVSLEIEAFKDRKFAGTVSAINPSVDPTSRSAVIEALVENNANLLRPGMFATARITRQGGSTGIFVPRSAVLFDETTQSYKAFVIQEGIAKLRVVQLGTEENDMYQILNGVNADEMVATSNLNQLYEGAKVEIVQ
jgi:RND family efflux transporter MFP subunit